MDTTKRKNNKYITKVCPECGGRLRNIEESHTKSGVTYSETSHVCLECGWEEAFVNKRNRRKADVE
jgi:RNase P subunit RPR2